MQLPRPRATMHGPPLQDPTEGRTWPQPNMSTIKAAFPRSGLPELSVVESLDPLLHDPSPRQFSPVSSDRH